MSDGPPSGAAPYKRTPVFDQDTLPEGLRHEHHTKPGVWGLIRVIEGRLRYRVIDPPNEQVLSPEVPGLVRPEQRHEVAPVGPVRFFVEFYTSEPVIGAPD